MNLKKKVELLGLEIPVLAIVAVLAGGLGAAALLSSYGTITGTADVSQSVQVYNENDGSWMTCTGSESTGCTWSNAYSSTSAGGSTEVEGPFKLKTNAEVPASVSLATLCSYSGDATEDSCNDISTTYKLVTTAFAKRAGSVTWSDGSVTLNVDGSSSSDYDDGAAVVMVPLNKKVSDVSDMSISLGGSSVGDAYAQIMVDLNPSDASSNWAQVVKKGSNDYNLWIYSSEFSVVDSWSHITASEVETKLENNYANPTVIGVKGNLWSNSEDLTGTVDSITFDGTTYELNKDDRHGLVTTQIWMPPLPGEQFEFTVTHEFPLETIPGTYSFTTSVNPAGA